MDVYCEYFFAMFKWRKIEENLKTSVGVLIGIILVLTVTLVIVSVVKTKNSAIILEKENSLQSNVCLSPACSEVSSRILQNMDTTVDPCDDFYNFACGNFVKNTYLHTDQYLASAFLDIKKTVYQQIQNILEDSLHEDELRPFTLTKQFYKLCMNTSAIESDGLFPVKGLLEALNGWPVLKNDKSYDAKFDWKETTYLLRKLGFEPDSILTVDVVINPANSSVHIISLDKPEFGIDMKYLVNGLNDDATKSYFKYMVDVAVMFGANQTSAIADFEKVLNLEIGLAKIWLLSKDTLDETMAYNPITAGKLRHKYPHTDWKNYLKYLLDSPDFKITDNELVIIRNPQYLDNLATLLDSTPKRVQANYIIWKAVNSIIPYLTKNLRNRRLVFLKETNGEYRLLSRSQECTVETMENLWESITNAYLRKHSHQRNKELVTDMFSKMGETFIKLIESTNWMDNNTKQNAYEKAKGLPFFTIFSDEMDDDELVKFYSTLNFNDENYLKSVLAVKLFHSNNKFKKIWQPVTKQDREWDVSLIYQMGIPQGLFQGLLFHKDRPSYVNYGTIGSIIGHLLTHIFDEYGSKYDRNLHFTDWWTSSTKVAYKNVSQCIIKHYSNYTVPETQKNLSGKQTVHEDIADITGLKLAYLTYSNWSKSNVEQQLPGLNYTQKQMFWISSANMWCTKYRIEYLRYILLLKSFSPSYYRVTAALRNLPYFSDDFKCLPNSYMNPDVKCQIW